MKPSTSHFHTLRNLRYHVRTWGSPEHPVVFMLHGWMDVSASFQFLVNALERDWYVVAPDWRGFGLTDWSPEPYWFPDYYSDLDALLDVYSSKSPALMVAHSMGGNIACTYAGIRPARIARLVSLEGFGYLRMAARIAPDRYARWLEDLREPPRLRPYASLEEVAKRMHGRNPRLPRDRALFLAEHWARRTESGEYILRADPKHKMSNPVLNRIEEHMACWQRITAPVMWVWGRETQSTASKQDTPAQWDERRSAFRDLREATIDEAGHMIHLDQPERLARVIEPFLMGH